MVNYCRRDEIFQKVIFIPTVKRDPRLNVNEARAVTQQNY